MTIGKKDIDDSGRLVMAVCDKSNDSYHYDIMAKSDEKQLLAEYGQVHVWQLR